jgi:hypothetical protein
MNVRVNHEADTDPTFFGFVQIHLRIVDGVAHGGQTLAPSTEDVGGRDDGIDVKQLPENHKPVLRMGVCGCGSGPAARGSPLARQS